jgi:TctA family transporter
MTPTPKNRLAALQEKVTWHRQRVSALQYLGGHVQDLAGIYLPGVVTAVETLIATEVERSQEEIKYLHGVMKTITVNNKRPVPGRKRIE